MKLDITSAFSWLLANKDQLVVAAATVVAGASLIVKGLELLVGLLVLVFPGLRDVDGELQSVAAFLDRVAKSRVLNRVAMSPKGALKVLALLAAVSLATPSTARAESFTLSSGPTLPLLEVRLGSGPAGKAGTSVLAAGAGYQLNASFLPREIAGKRFDLFQLGLAAFASGSPTGGQGSIALLGCTLNQLICAGFGADIVSFGGPDVTGLLAGRVSRANLFALLSVGFEIGFGPQTPPVGLTFDETAFGLSRGNHLQVL